MNRRTWQRALLYTFLAFIVGGQLGQTYGLLASLRDPDSSPAWPFFFDWDSLAVTRVVDAGAAGGLAAGDIIQERGVSGLYAHMRGARSGQVRTLRVRRLSQPMEVNVTLVAPRTGNASSAQLEFLFAAQIPTYWACSLLGMFVVLRRPDDKLAWLLLLMLLGMMSMTVTMREEHRWPQPWASIYRFFNDSMQTTWGLWMMWFAMDFPDPCSTRRLAGWTRWPLTLLVGGMGLCTALEAAWQLADLGSSGAVTMLAGWFGPYQFWAGSACVGLFFANLGFKSGIETRSDVRRRLRLLMWGTQLSLWPMFASILVSRFRYGGDFSALPAWVWVPALAMLLLFPLTFAYVIVVERALDVGVVVRQGVQHALATGTVSVVRSLVIAVAGYAAISQARNGELFSWTGAATFAGLLAIILLVRRAAHRLRLWLDRRFFRDQAHTEEVLAALSREVGSLSDPATVCRRIGEALPVNDVQIAADGSGELVFPLSGGESLILGPKRNDEPYSPSERRMLETVAAQTSLALDNARLVRTLAEEAVQRDRRTRELEIARDVQQRLLPRSGLAGEGFAVEGRCRPAQEIGGDYFDVREMGGTVACALGDVAGKGVPAALLMAGLQSSLRALQAAGVDAPAPLLEKLNTLTYESTARNRFATMTYITFDPATRRLSYASAGHPASLLARRSGQVERLSRRGLALGLRRVSVYQEETLTLEPGDVLVLYSDGFSEAMNERQEEFGEDRFAALLPAVAQKPATGIVDALFAEVDRWAAGAAQHDDMTLVVLKRAE